MRKLNCLLVMLALCVLCGCSEIEDEVVNSQLSVNPGQLEFPYEGGCLTLNIENNTDWGISDLPEWLSASTVSGIRNTTITINAEYNTDNSDRTARFYVFTHDGQKKVEVVVTQGGTHSSPIIIDNTAEIIFGGNRSTNYEGPISIVCDTQWSIEGPSWLDAVFNDTSFSLGEKNVCSGSGTIYLAAIEAYTGDATRYDTIYIKTSSGEASAKLPVCQLGRNEIRSYKEMVLSDGCAFNVKCGTNVRRIRKYIYEGDIPSALTYADINANWLSSQTSETVVHVFPSLKPATDYVVCWIGVNADGYYVPLSEINKYRIHTPSDVRQPMAYISKPVFADSKWYLPIHPNEYTCAYEFGNYTYTEALKTLDYNYLKIYLAFNFICYPGVIMMSDGDDMFEIEHSVDCVFISLARGFDGNMSSNVDMYISVKEE